MVSAMGASLGWCKRRGPTDLQSIRVKKSNHLTPCYHHVPFHWGLALLGHKSGNHVELWMHYHRCCDSAVVPCQNKSICWSLSVSSKHSSRLLWCLQKPFRVWDSFNSLYVGLIHDEKGAICFVCHSWQWYFVDKQVVNVDVDVD